MENLFFEKNANKYPYIFSDCQLVKGFARTSICDTSRKKIFFITNEYYELTKLFRVKTIREIEKMLDGKKSLLQFYKFLNFLLDERIAILVDNIHSFPEIDIYWDDPSVILYGILDVRNKFQYLSKSLYELSLLRCKYLQIRIFDEIDSETLLYICSLIKGKCFEDVEMLIKYSKFCTDHKTLEDIIDNKKNIRIIFHSAPNSLKHSIMNRIKYTSQVIDSASHCGIINLHTFNIPSIQGFMENKLYNSCLNRKISVDEYGYIKNCPSLEKQYGHISDTSLIDVAKENSFQKIGGINKDKISICKDCEFRYMCSDCRAYTEKGQKMGKPSKCKYNPYECRWEA